MRKYYITEKEDYATPAFATISKLYLGNLEDEKDVKFYIEPVFEIEKIINPFDFNHTNIWGANYHLKLGEIKIKIIWTKFLNPKKQKEEYYRFVYYDLEYAKLRDDFTNNYEILDYGWGNPEILIYNGERIVSNYAILDKTFDNKEIFEKEIEEVKTNKNYIFDLDFSRLFDEIFADG